LLRTAISTKQVLRSVRFCAHLESIANMSPEDDPYLALLPEAYAAFAKVDGDVRELDEIFINSNTLTTPQSSLCRWIFQQACGWSKVGMDGLELQKEVAMVVGCIPDFDEEQRAHTTRMVVEMVEELSNEQDNTSSCLSSGATLEDEWDADCDCPEAVGSEVRNGICGSGSERKGVFFEYPDFEDVSEVERYCIKDGYARSIELSVDLDVFSSDETEICRRMCPVPSIIITPPA
jgi:hypothetical protein